MTHFNCQAHAISTRHNFQAHGITNAPQPVHQYKACNDLAQSKARTETLRGNTWATCAKATSPNYLTKA